MQRSLFPKDGLPRQLRADFEAFWDAYPSRRPNPRALAETAFARAVAQGARPEDLVRAADGYCAEVRKMGIGQEFVVHAATFLRQRRWQDYLHDPVAAAPARPAEPEHALWPALRTRLSPTDFRAWIAPLTVLSHTDGEAALLEAPTAFHRSHVLMHHSVALKAALRVKRMDIVVRGEWEP